MRISTVENQDDSRYSVVIHVANVKVYPITSLNVQMDDTLAMLAAEARSVGASDLIGVRFEPVWDAARSINVLMAYGTALIELLD